MKVMMAGLSVLLLAACASNGVSKSTNRVPSSATNTKQDSKIIQTVMEDDFISGVMTPILKKRSDYYCSKPKLISSSRNEGQLEAEIWVLCSSSKSLVEYFDANEDGAGGSWSMYKINYKDGYTSADVSVSRKTGVTD